MVRSSADGNPDDTTLPMTGEASSPANAHGLVKKNPPRCIIKLGAPGSIAGFDVDTSHFNGAPVV